MRTVAKAIVDYRYIIFVLFIIAAIYCVLSLGRVRVNSDLTAFLPSDAETRRGLTVMEEEFVTYGSANVMVSNVTYEMAERLSDAIRDIPHVTDVVFDDTTAHYIRSSALFSISFDGQGTEPEVVSAMERIREIVRPYDHYISTVIGEDFSAQLASEMGVVIALAAVVIVAVLLFTSRSYFEVVIFGIVFAFAALLNMGTNFWLGEISSISHSVAIILQLALAIDYAIIFAHRYQDEATVRGSVREALVEALAKSIVEISSSSLTTISGLVALTLMQFRLGYDLGVVLAKGIICSMLTVFLLMPGLIMLFPRALKKTQHKKLIPDITGWGRFLMKYRLVFVILFAVILPFAIVCSGRTEYAFSDGTVDELIHSDSRAAMHKINDTFAPSTAVALLVPAGDFEAEKAILRETEELPEIKAATGLANIRIDDTHVLTDPFTPRMFAELLDIDVEEARLLYQAYGFEHDDFQPIFGSTATYEVPLIDMLFYLFEKIDQGIVTLSGDQREMLDSLRGSLERGDDQLRGNEWDRLVFTANIPAEGDESTALVETMRAIADAHYGAETCLVVGDITSARDLHDSYNSDSLLINILTIAFVFTILLFTFKTVAGAAVLVFVIQGSIWINFTFPYLTGTHASFVTDMIVSAIQMGATIDYAIVIMNRYLARKKDLPNREAMTAAVNESFPTVLTSGAILTVAALLIAFRVSDVYVGHIGLAVGRGALISVILVLTVLPQLIVLTDKLIEKTRFRISPADIVSPEAEAPLNGGSAAEASPEGISRTEAFPDEAEGGAK